MLNVKEENCKLKTKFEAFSVERKGKFEFHFENYTCRAKYSNVLMFSRTGTDMYA